MCDKISDIEWSGVPFYSIKGDFNTPDKCIITVEDIFPMNIGTTGYTEHDYNEDLFKYMMENPHTMELKQGLIHSH